MTTDIAEPETVPHASRWEDFVDIFFSPAEVFRRRRDGQYGLALAFLTVILTVLTYGFYAALSAAFEADFARGIAAAGEEAAAQLPVETMMAFSRNITIFGSVVLIPLGALITGLFIWLAARMLGGRLSFVLGVTIATYATFPRILSTLSGILQGTLLNPDSLSRVSLGPARFLDPATTSVALIGLAGRIDLFVIWSLVLTAIGLQVIGGMERSRAYLGAFFIWLLAGLPVAIPALITYVSGS